MKINIGKNTLGDTDKMSLSLREYGRSTHDLSFAWRGTMSVGALVPTLKILALPGDTFEINIESKILTVPTVGPLFGSFKFQTDIFTCPIRLYNALLHNNALNIGLDMKKVKFPVINYLQGKSDYKAYSPAFMYNPTGLIFNLGLKGVTSVRKNYNYGLMPFMMYYDIFKNYYANKQEENYYQFLAPYIEWGDSWVYDNILTIKVSSDVQTNNVLEIKTDLVPYLDNIIVQVEGNLDKDDQEILLSSFLNERYFTRQDSYNGITKYIITQEGFTAAESQTCYRNSFTNKSTYAVLDRGTYELLQTPYPPNAVGVYNKNTPQTFKLEEIDDLREYILSQGKKAIQITQNDVINTPTQLKPLMRLFQPENVTMDNAGLIVKTHMSDIFNNWIKNETISGTNGIKELTKIDTSEGFFTIDTLNLAKKVYEMLNRIAVSGGTYKDWIETVYTTDYYFRAETPVYEGGMSCEVVFDEVVSQAANIDTNEPLGTLAGRGMSVNNKGGSLIIKVNEPCYIIGISSLTPRVDYCQGNDWDMMNLNTMDDLHKPQLDGIGFQDLLSYKACWGTQYAIGKQPAWLDYMTNFNKTSGKFAVGESQSFMVLNKIYNNGRTIQDDMPYAGFTTYIRPADFNYIFAETEDNAHNFWVQLGYGINSRRVMSAKEMPNP